MGRRQTGWKTDRNRDAGREGHRKRGKSRHTETNRQRQGGTKKQTLATLFSIALEPLGWFLQPALCTANSWKENVVRF